MACLRLSRADSAGRVLLVALGLGLVGPRPAAAGAPSAPEVEAADMQAAAGQEGAAEFEAAGGTADRATAEAALSADAKAAAERAAAEAEAAAAAREAEKRARQERVVAFARQRVREMAERKRAQAATEARERKRARAAAKQAERARRERTAAAAALPLPEIVDHRSALERQLAAHWGWGADKDRQVRVPLPDWQNWQRVRLFGVEHLAAFRYTKEHHTLTAVFTVETRAQKPSSLTCMDEFERRGFPQLKRHGVHIEPIATRSAHWDERPVLVHETDGRVTFLFSRYEFSAAWTAYPAYDHGCLVYATVVLWDGQPELARRVLDRFVTEGVAQVRPLTPFVPTRLDDGGGRDPGGAAAE